MNANVKRLMNARKELVEAKNAVYEDVFNALDSNGKFACEIAEELDIPSPIVLGALMSNESRFFRSYRTCSSTVRKTYARIRKDGTIDMNDTVDVCYHAAKYVKRG